MSIHHTASQAVMYWFLFLRDAQDKKKFYRWTTDDRLALIEKSIKRERRIVEKIRVDVEEEKGMLRRASRPSGDVEVLAKIAMNSIEEGSPTKANRRKSSIR